MNYSRQPLTRLASSESGTRTRATPRVQPPSQQVDDEFSAFFDRGDLGDYEGGESHSRVPVSADPVTPDDSRVRKRGAHFSPKWSRSLSLVAFHCCWSR